MYQVSLTESLFPAQTDEPIRQTTVGDKLREVAARDSCAPALVEVTIEGETARRWTYGELPAESEELALALASRFAPGERVAVWANNLPEWIFVEYACGLAGLVLVTVNPAFQQKELRYVLEQSGAVALFRVESYRANPMAAIGAEAVEGLEAVREVVDLRDRTALHRMGERAQGLPEVKPGDPAQIQYTSGTTGFPKGAVLSHRGLINNARFYVDRCGTTGDTTWSRTSPRSSRASAPRRFGSGGSCSSGSPIQVRGSCSSGPPMQGAYSCTSPAPGRARRRCKASRESGVTGATSPAAISSTVWNATLCTSSGWSVNGPSCTQVNTRPKQRLPSSS